jgi:hypothetical protein
MTSGRRFDDGQTRTQAKCFAVDNYQNGWEFLKLQIVVCNHRCRYFCVLFLKPNSKIAA